MAYIGNTVNNQGFTPAIDYFSGNGSTVTFTLSRPVVSVAQVIAVIENVPQNPSTAFSVSGNSITFTSAPPSGSNNIWIEYTSLITTYNAISQDPSVIGDITATGGFLAVGDFGNTYTDGTIVDYVTGNARITTGPADGLTIYNGGTSARNALMAIDASGNVGIGTASPATKIDSTGITRSAGFSLSNIGAGVIGGTTAFSAGTITTDTNWGMYFRAPTGSSAAAEYAWVNAGGTERMRIDSSGGIWSSTMTQGFQLRSGGTQYGGMFFDLGYLSFQTYQAGNTWMRFIHYGGGQTNFQNGSNYNTNNVWGGISDVSLKDNIVDASPKLEDLLKVKIRQYTLKQDEAKKKQIGVIAQELQEVFPGLVDKGDEDLLSVKYTVFIPILIKAIQEQQAIIEDLKARIETLEAK